MKLLSEKNYHLFFRIGVIIKAAISLGEIILGIAFIFLSYETMYRIMLPLIGGELSETPRDLIWTYIVGGARNFSMTPQSVWAFIFLSHGILKTFLVVGLWKNRSWAYPASAAVFAFFIVYQLYQLTFTPSVFLWVITIFDGVLIGLILHEYQHKKKNSFG